MKKIINSAEQYPFYSMDNYAPDYGWREDLSQEVDDAFVDEYEEVMKRFWDMQDRLRAALIDADAIA